MTPTQGSLVKRTFLYALIASIVLSAGLGILAILAGNWGWLEIRVLLTTVTISAASICGLGCGAYLAVGGHRGLPMTGIALAIGAAALIIFGMWTEVTTEAYWKAAASLSVFAVACGHLSLLSMARLAEQFRWSLVTAYVVIFGVAALIVAMILGEPRGEAMFRLLAVAAIIDAAITILVPVFHWMSRMHGAAAMPAFAVAGDAAAADIDSRRAAIDEEIAALKKRIAELERQRAAIS
jgi:hypothetical protein